MNKIDLSQSYTFSKFFELKIAANDLARSFGYSFDRIFLKLPEHAGKLDRTSQTRERIEEVLPFVNLSNETARREILISPIIYDLIHYTQIEVRIEYPLRASDQLQGYVDYLLESPSRVLIVEAKKEDLELGMTQLIAELIALDRWLDADTNPLVGAVTTGKIWEFARLDRQAQTISQGLESYRVPADLETLTRILVHALT
jgi:hypothetical protein